MVGRTNAKCVLASHLIFLAFTAKVAMGQTVTGKQTKLKFKCSVTRLENYAIVQQSGGQSTDISISRIPVFPPKTPGESFTPPQHNRNPPKLRNTNFQTSNFKTVQVQNGTTLTATITSPGPLNARAPQANDESGKDYYTAALVRQINIRGLLPDPLYADLQKLIEEIEGLIRKYGLYKDSINWKQTYDQINRLRFTDADSTNHRLILDIFTQNLRNAGDKHSYFSKPAPSKSSNNRGYNTKPKALYLGSGIGLIKVPLCLNDQKAKDIRYANTIREQIRKIDSRNEISDWIIDLRGNIGGNMWPMLAGLNALIEDGTVGYFINPASKTEQPWPSYNGILQLPNAKINNYKIKVPQIKLAILIDSMTASSGEMTAVSFLGMSNVKIFGQPSAGYTTANTTYYLSDGTMFNLATSYIADRTRKAYRDKIIPDYLLRGHGDQGIAEVIEIIKNQ